MFANKKKQRRDLLVITVLAIALAIPLYYWFLHSDKHVDFGIVKLQTKISTHKERVWACRFSGSQNVIASAGIDSVVHIHNVSGDLRASLRHPVPITNIAFNNDGTLLATVAYDGRLRIWNIPERKLQTQWQAQEGTAWTVAWHPSAKLIATAGEDKLVKVWNAETGKLQQSMSGHTLNIWAVVFSRDGRHLVSSGFDKSIRVWDVNSGKLLNTINGHDEAVVSLDVSADGNLLASGSDDGDIKLWSMHDYSLVKTVGTNLRHVYGLAFHPNRNLLLSGHLDKPVVGEVLQNFFGDTHGNRGTSARLWDVTSGKLLQTMNEHGNDVNDVSWSLDGRYFSTCSEDKQVHVWRMVERQ